MYGRLPLIHLAGQAWSSTCKLKMVGDKKQNSYGKELINI